MILKEPHSPFPRSLFLSPFPPRPCPFSSCWFSIMFHRNLFLCSSLLFLLFLLFFPLQFPSNPLLNRVLQTKPIGSIRTLMRIGSSHHYGGQKVPQSAICKENWWCNSVWVWRPKNQKALTIGPGVQRPVNQELQCPRARDYDVHLFVLYRF